VVIVVFPAPVVVLENTLAVARISDVVIVSDVLKYQRREK
jgi:hypothetical protein